MDLATQKFQSPDRRSAPDYFEMVLSGTGARKTAASLRRCRGAYEFDSVGYRSSQSCAVIQQDERFHFETTSNIFWDSIRDDRLVAVLLELRSATSALAKLQQHPVSRPVLL